MKWFFVVYGMTWLVAIAAFALRQVWAWWAMAVLAIGSLCTWFPERSSA